MKITKLKKNWAVKVETTYEEAMSQDKDFWRNLGYEHDLVFIRGFGYIDNIKVNKFVSRFGKPYDTKDYDYSLEKGRSEFDENGKEYHFSYYRNSSTIDNLKDRELPWHADIPIRKGREFPWRCLYNLRPGTGPNNPDGGITGFMNLTFDVIKPTAKDLKYYNRIEVINQSWHGHEDELQKNSYIKTCPFDGKTSLRTNYFVSPKWPARAYIKETLLDGEPVDNLATLGPIHKKLESKKQVTYYHTWEKFDFIIYNNWSMLHNRSRLNMTEDQDRLFVRLNIDHVANDQWDDYKETID